MAQASDLSVEGNSPRSTVLPSPDRTTSGVPSMNGNSTDGGTAAGGKLDPAREAEAADANEDYKGQESESVQPKDSKEPDSPSQPNSYGHLTPQPQVVGYPPYPSQVTPASPSPTASNAVFTDAYGAAFLRPQSAGAGAFIPHANPFGGHPSPLSPPRPTTAPGVVNAAGGVPPNSPLFPRLSGNQSNFHPNGFDRVMQPPSPTLAYTTGVYQTYAGASTGMSGSLQQSGSMDESQGTHGGWMDSGDYRMVSSQYAQNSPQLSASGVPMYGMQMGRGNARAPSFDGEPMLPPSALDAQDPGNPNYSPYSQASNNGGNLFQHQQPWGYGGLPEMYSGSQVSPLQPRPTHQIPMGYPMAPQMRPMGPYGSYFPACSPGAPIQTTASNKGPQGSNLFVFHIPNNMTNLDMFQLFSPYGNLISVRIMVEKDTGRSRGFGFVSFDNPESAALAIKELNGFAIGNKRLKVQHKQIRPKDIQQDRDHMHGYGMPSDEYDRPQHGSSLPPSGPGAANSWLSTAPNGSEMAGRMPETHDGKVDEGTEQTSTSTNGENQGISPLTSLGTLQDALPEVSSRQE
mmetsp:Transcript_17847/g.33891  ORF Transcript_17847/g.33891 Transcript_17847/m.33891 type:complete len:572 (-) Transcript_17847:56-1771(-)